MRFARAELVPPRPAEWPAVMRGFNDLLRSARQQRWRHLTVRVRAPPIPFARTAHCPTAPPATSVAHQTRSLLSYILIFTYTFFHVYYVSLSSAFLVITSDFRGLLYLVITSDFRGLLYLVFEN